jgi:hypothetical protein
MISPINAGANYHTRHISYMHTLRTTSLLLIVELIQLLREIACPPRTRCLARWLLCGLHTRSFTTGLIDHV